MIARRAIPDEDHVSRFVPYRRQERDPVTDEFKGLTFDACALRADDHGHMSVTWIEFFGPYAPDAKLAAAIAFRASLPTKKLPAKAAFAYAQVSNVKAAALRYDKNVRVVWDPVDGNQGHAEVRQFSDEDARLLELLASETFGDCDIVQSMNLPPV